MIGVVLAGLVAQPAPVTLTIPAPSDAIAAERAFAARAQVEGQWTAFRATAAPDAIMLAPGPVNAHQFLARFTSDPKVAVMWWPARVWTSCDGSMAVTTGPWVRRGGTQVGTFTTVWRREANGQWRWVYDNGREVPAAIAAPEDPAVEQVHCGRQSGRVDPSPVRPPDVQFEGRPLNDGLEEFAAIELGTGVAGGRSPDGSLSWNVSRVAGRGANAYQFSLFVRTPGRLRVALVEFHGMEPLSKP
jgi:hypothetical protein